MARPGDVIENPAIGDRILFRRTTRETNGELLEVEVFVQPSATGAPMHVHPESAERVEVLKGTLRARVGERDMRVHEGDEFSIPAGTPHTWWNVGGTEAHVLIELRPASRMEPFLETLYGLAKDGRTNAKGVPSPLQLAITAHAYFDVFHLATPPLAAQKAVFGVLQPIARLLGYKANHPYPYPEAR